MHKMINNAGRALAAIGFAAVAFAIAAPAQAAPGMVTGNINVRTGPGVNYSTIGTVLYGEDVDIARCKRGWCYISHPGADGWVSQKYLARAVQRRYDSTPSVGISFGFGGWGGHHHHDHGRGKIHWKKPSKIHIPGPNL
ncbi:SH3 domain-containing protein [Shinella curvata]|uniref:SH3 domain-containing protein n=1 Tax=Shinella curvata TaxID=1817964 RepID=A0ABT8X9Z1_9HYPH|nr:SH3 domain-containing protein [Shinella curvata]MCJ8055137.1 SH3 domain-containing protein [Shinella curvata]MDO6120467.1 SH3 domain-containing protein [Shinella curvata]